MLEFQYQNQFFIFNFDEHHPELSAFFSPHFWQKQQRILGSAQGRGTTWFLNTQDLFGMNTALRHYYRGGLWGKLNKDCYVFTSLAETRSFAEFYLLDQLNKANFPAPKPLGARIEKLPFNLYRADILTEKIENAQDLTALLQYELLSEDVWQQIGQLIRQLHDLQICHSDLNAHNILLQQNKDETKCWLIDFDKCGQKSGDFWKEANLQRLYRSFMKEKVRMHIQFTDENWQQLLAGYQK